MSITVQVELEVFRLAERRPSGVRALLVQVGGMTYPAVYSDERGFVWVDGEPIEESIEAWAVFSSAPIAGVQQ